MTPNIENFNDDELEAPEWLNTDFFTKVLQNCVKDTSFKIKNLKLSPASAKGDHYASVMFRATIEYEVNGSKDTKEKRLIIKTMPEMDGHKKDMLNETHIFETEIGMYTEVIPKLESILRSVGDKTVLSAPCVYHSLSPKQIIIFEDIVPHGYEVLRGRSINMDEAKAAYLKLAKWHAASYKLLKEDPKYFDQYCHSIFSSKKMTENELFNRGVGNLVTVLEETPDLRKYKKYIESFSENLLQRCIDTYHEYFTNPNENSDYVLCHGDFHCKNFMFKNNATTGALEDVMLLDFQFCYAGPIVNDLIYSIIMLMDDDFRLNRRDELLYYYFTNFRSTLQKIGYEGKLPKISEFREQLMQHRHLEIFLLATFLPFWYGFKDGTADVNEMLEQPEKLINLYRKENYIEELRNLLPKYLHLGYFDE